MATSNQDTNIKDVAAPASANTTNIGHVLGLNAAKTQDVLIPLSMLRTVIAAELKTALAAITSGSPDVPVLDGNNLKYMTLANFAKVVGEQHNGSIAPGSNVEIPRGVYLFGQAYYGFGLASFGQSTIDDHTNVQTKLNISFERVTSATIRVTNNRSSSVYTYYKLLWYLP